MKDDDMKVLLPDWVDFIIDLHANSGEWAFIEDAEDVRNFLYTVVEDIFIRMMDESFD